MVDGGNGDVDNNHAKDFVGRLFLHPVQVRSLQPARQPRRRRRRAAWGNQRGTPATFDTTGATPRRTATSVPGLPSYRSAGQQTFFTYLVNDDAIDATVIGRGRRTRLSPQGYFYYGGLGLLGEYVQSRQHVVKGSTSADLTHKAWQAQASYVFGGKNAFEGVTVIAPFEPSKGNWGALELGARYNALLLDEDTFPTYANPSRVGQQGARPGARWSTGTGAATSS